MCCTNLEIDWRREYLPGFPGLLAAHVLVPAWLTLSRHTSCQATGFPGFELVSRSSTERRGCRASGIEWVDIGDTMFCRCTAA